MKRLLSIVAMVSVAVTGFAAVPAQAQDYSRYGYQQNDGQFDDNQQDSRYDRYQRERQDAYRHYQAQTRHRYYAHRNGAYYHSAPRYDTQAYQDGTVDQGYRSVRRCHSGTTGAILGAVLGGLLGREIGRGGEFNDPSTTGLVIGAGGGALAGRAIERNGCH